jgi:hypothetical protein
VNWIDTARRCTASVMDPSLLAAAFQVVAGGVLIF